MAFQVTGQGQYSESVYNSVKKVTEHYFRFRESYARWMELERVEGFMHQSEESQFMAIWTPLDDLFHTSMTRLTKTAQSICDLTVSQESQSAMQEYKRELNLLILQLHRDSDNVRTVCDGLEKLASEIGRSKTAEMHQSGSSREASMLKDIFEELNVVRNDLLSEWNVLDTYARYNADDVINLQETELDEDEIEQLEKAETIDDVNAVVNIGMGRQTIKRKCVNKAVKEYRKMPIPLDDTQKVWSNIVAPAIEAVGFTVVALAALLLNTKFAQSAEAKALIAKVPKLVDNTISDSAFSDEVYEEFEQIVREDGEPTESYNEP